MCDTASHFLNERGGKGVGVIGLRWSERSNAHREPSGGMLVNEGELGQRCIGGVRLGRGPVGTTWCK